MVVACDGLWDMLSSQRCIEIARQHLRDHNNPQTCAQFLVTLLPCTILFGATLCALAREGMSSCSHHLVYCSLYDGPAKGCPRVVPLVHRACVVTREDVVCTNESGCFLQGGKMLHSAKWGVH